MNNITPLVQSSLEKITEMYENPRTAPFINHLLLAFGDNNGVVLKKSVFKPCAITGKKAINVHAVKGIEDIILKQKVTNFLLSSVPTRDRIILDWVAKFNWTEYDTMYTTTMYCSLSSEVVLTKQAYIALQKFQTLLKEKKAVPVTTEVVNIFVDLQPVKQTKKKK